VLQQTDVACNYISDLAWQEKSLINLRCKNDAILSSISSLGFPLLFITDGISAHADVNAMVNIGRRGSSANTPYADAIQMVNCTPCL